MSPAFLVGYSRVVIRRKLSAALCLLLASFSISAIADEAQDCTDSDGTLLVGTVVSPPRFAHGTYRKGVELSHTHLTLRSDADGTAYDVAMDNVFAPGYSKNAKSVPAPLNSISVGDKLELCGITFKDGKHSGIHWVHDNCGDTPTSQDPNGWVKKKEDESVNLEGSQTYCYLWPHH